MNSKGASVFNLSDSRKITKVAEGLCPNCRDAASSFLMLGQPESLHQQFSMTAKEQFRTGYSAQHVAGEIVFLVHQDCDAGASLSLLGIPHGLAPGSPMEQRATRFVLETASHPRKGRNLYHRSESAALGLSARRLGKLERANKWVTARENRETCRMYQRWTS